MVARWQVLHAKSLTPQGLFHTMDSNRDNRISFEEFKRGLAAAGVRPIPSEGEARAVFESFDRDEDDTLSIDEIVASLAAAPAKALELAYPKPGQAGKPGPKDGRSPSQEPPGPPTPPRRSEMEGWVKVLSPNSEERWLTLVDDAICTGTKVSVLCLEAHICSFEP